MSVGWRGRGGKARRALIGVAAVLLTLPTFAGLSPIAARMLEARGQGDTARVALLGADAEQQWRKAPTLDNTNDLAIAWVLAGRTAEGIQLLKDFEKTDPGSAKVAAYLGTALELAGADQEALLWIRESVRRDPREHEGSEWVHAKILEAKLALSRDRNWLRTHSVVGWREGQPLLADERGLVRSPVDLIAPIRYQLEVRTQLVEAPDAIVGDLYLTLGDIAHSYPGAFPNAWERDAAEATNYRSALNFGTVHEVRVRERLEEADRRIEASRPERQAAAQREQQARQQAERRAERQRLEDQQRAMRREEQIRRRQLALWVFVALTAIAAVAILWRRRRAAP